MKIKYYLLLTFYSVLLTSIGSGLLAFGLYYWVQNFWGVFFTATAIQIIVFYMFNTYLQYRTDRQSEQLLNDLESRKLKFTTKLACAYCKTSDDVIVDLNDVNTHTCEYCKQVNGIKVQVIATQTIKPVTNVAAKIVNIVDTTT